MSEHSPLFREPAGPGFSLLPSIAPVRSSSLAKTFMKLYLLVRLLPGHFVEFWDRVTTFIAVCWDWKRSKSPGYNTIEWAKAADALQRVLKAEVPKLLRETPLLEMEYEVLDQLGRIRITGPFSMAHNADLDLGRCCYAACRALRPYVVLVTRVAYGVTTRFVLQALTVNGEGQLWSVDLPPLGIDADAQVGVLVPRELRGRWHLVRGPSKRVLPKLLSSLPKVDIFIHDSLHTYANMKSEFQAVWPILRPAGILIADDVGGNYAFRDFAREVRPSFCAVIREQNKDSVFGILVKGI